MRWRRQFLVNFNAEWKEIDPMFGLLLMSVSKRVDSDAFGFGLGDEDGAGDDVDFEAAVIVAPLAGVIGG